MGIKQVFTHLNILADRANRSKLLRLLERDSGAKMLDLGCADGSFTVTAAKTVGTEEVFGADMDREACIAAGEKGISVTIANLNQGLPYANNSFDVVIANQVIEHLPRTDLFVKEILRILKPGGYVVVSTPNLGSWHNIAFLLVGFQPPFCLVSDEVYQLGNPIASLYMKKREHVTHGHLRIFTVLALKQLFQYHRYKVEAALGGGYAAYPQFLSRILSRLDPWHSVYAIVKARKI